MITVHRRIRDCAFVGGLVALALFKLWLIHNEEICGYTTEYDCLWYLDSAKHWYWNTPYSWTAFFRPVAYPLFIAVVHAFGIPLRVAVELLQMGGYLLLTSVLGKTGIPRWLCLSIFAALLFHPASFVINNYALPDGFYGGVLSAAIATLFWTLRTNKIGPAICTGVAFAVLWNTREADVLLPVIFSIYLGLGCLRFFSETRSWRQAGLNLLAPALSIFATAALLTIGVYAANYRAFGSLAKSEMTAPSFTAAYRALLRIKPTRTQRFIPVSQEAFGLAYQVSPTFVKLRDSFEGKLGHDWQLETLSTHGIHGEIGAGWLRFALRSVSASAGVFQNPAKSKNFYRKVAKEINLACDQKRIPSRFIVSTFLDPGALGALRFFPESLARIGSLFFWRYQTSPDREDAILRPAQRALYDEMAGRRAALTQIGTLRLVGWAFQFDDPVTMVAYDNGGGEIESGLTRFSPRPDVVESFKDRGIAPLNMEFGVSIPLRRGKVPSGNLLVITRSGRLFCASVPRLLAGTSPTENGAEDGAPLNCHIFAQEFTPSSSDQWPLPIKHFIGNYHRPFVIALSWIGLAGAVVILLCYRRLRLNDPINTLLILLVAVIGSRVVLFAYIDATSWRAQDPRYVFPVMPLYSAFLILLFHQAGRLIWSTRPQLFRPAAKVGT